MQTPLLRRIIVGQFGRACVVFRFAGILGAKIWEGIMKCAILGIAVGAAVHHVHRRANAATATRGAFGALSDGTKVEAVTLTNGAGRVGQDHDPGRHACNR